MATPGYVVLTWTNHWRIIDGRTHRDAVARRLADGQLRLIAVPDAV